MVVFDKYDKIYRAKLNLPEYVVMGNVFKCRDSSICFPSYDKFKNFKRKVTATSKNNCPDLVEEFYNCINDIGPNSAAIGLTISIFDNILSETYVDLTQSLKREYVTNKVALEIFK